MNRLKKRLAVVIAVAATASALAVPSLAANPQEDCTASQGRIIQRLRQEACKALDEILQRPSDNDCIYPQLPPQWKPENCPELPETPPESSEPDTDWPEIEWPDMNWPDSTPPDSSLPDSTPPSSDNAVPEIPDSMPEYAQEVVRLVNQERAKAGLQALQVDVKMQEAAQVRAKEQPILFSHTRPNGTSCFTALTEAGVDYSGAGENIAMGQKTPQEVMTGWMNSSGHRANILNSSFTHIGVGIYENGGRLYWAQMFTY